MNSQTTDETNGRSSIRRKPTGTIAMKKLIALLLLAGSALLAASNADSANPVPPPPPPYEGYGHPAADSAMLAQFAQAFAQPGMLPDSVGGWLPQMPDSIRARLQANHEALAAMRDSIRARLPTQPDSLKAQVHAMRDSAAARREAYLGAMNASDRSNVTPKLEALDARSKSRREAIQGSESSLKSRKAGGTTN